MGEDSDQSVVSVVVFVCLTLFVGAIVEALPDKVLNLFPQSVLVLLFFLVAGLIVLLVLDSTGKEDSDFVDILQALESSPEGVQLIFLPPLIFSELFKTNVHVFMNVLVQTLLLAFPGVLIGTVLTALFPVYILESSWTWYEALAFGGMLSATDPVAVIAVLHELGASKRLSAIIGGESVLNDGSAIVVVTLFLDLQAGTYFSASDIVAFIFQEVLGSLALGFAFGLAMMVLIPLLKNRPTPLVALTVALPYLCFASAIAGNMSGVLALVPMGLMTNAFGKAIIVGVIAERMEHFWNEAEFIANAVLFGISGVFIADDLLSGSISAGSWGYLVLLFVFIIAVRFVTVLLLYPFLKCSGYGLTIKEATVVWYGGLRGAVGLTLALLIRGSPGVDPVVGNLTTFFMGGMVALTLLINATTCGPLVKVLGLQHEADAHIIREIQRQFKDATIKSLEFAGGDRADIMSKLRRDKNDESSGTDTADKEESRNHLESVFGDVVTGQDSSSTSTSTTQNSPPTDRTMAEKRRHFLLAQVVTFNKLLEKSLIPRSAWYAVMNSVDIEIDDCFTPLNQWGTLIDSTFVQVILKFISTSSSDEDVEKLVNIFKNQLDFTLPLVPVEPEHHQNSEQPVAAVLEQLESGDDYLPSNINDENNNKNKKSKGCCGCGKNVDSSLMKLSYVAYAYLRAHEVSRRSINAFQSSVDRLREQRLRLHQESLETCGPPAHFLNAVRYFRPDLLRKMKAHQMGTSIKWNLLEKAFQLHELGLVEEAELHPILHLAHEISEASEEVDLPLHSRRRFVNTGDFELNEDLYPFVPREHHLPNHSPTQQQQPSPDILHLKGTQTRRKHATTMDQVVLEEPPLQFPEQGGTDNADDHDDKGIVTLGETAEKEEVQAPAGSSPPRERLILENILGELIPTTRELASRVLEESQSKRWYG